jgi:hypothetical protein
MDLCIYGQLGLKTNFGGVLLDQFPTKKPAFGLYCCPVQINQSLTNQFIIYTDTQLNLALGLASWLSFREDNFTQVQKFKLQLFNSKPQTATAACDFATSLELSSTTSLETGNLGVQARLSPAIPRILFPSYPTALHSIGDTFQKNGQFDNALDCHESAISAMSGWKRHRDVEMTAKWKCLFFNIFSDLLDVSLSLGTCNVGMDPLCNNALSWCYEPGVVAEDDKKAQYLVRFAKAKEAWGKPGAAFTLLMVALTFVQDQEELREALRRLRPQVDLSTINLISALHGIFASTGNLSMKSVELSQHDLPQDCSICLDPFKERETVERVIVCMHSYHKVCIQGWLNAQGPKCPGM